MEIEKHTQKHFCLSLSGALSNWKNSEWKSLAKENNMSVEKLKTLFKIYQFEGKKVIPVGDCDNFDYEKGCLGHG